MDAVRKIARILLLSIISVCYPSLGNEITVLSYDSMVGKGSLGEWMQIEFEKSHQDCKLKWLVTKDLSNLYSKFKNDRESKEPKISLVLGFDYDELSWAREKGWVEKEDLFEWSPYALIVNTKVLPQKNWPKNWSELTKKFQNSFYVQDPRLSQVGLGFLSVIYRQKPTEEKSLKSIIKRSFPSWSAAYSQFQKDDVAGVWSYQTSEAYHLCNEKDSPFRALPLEDGYPIQESYLLLAKSPKAQSGSELSVDSCSLKFFNFSLSQNTQSQIPIKNWMLPAKKIKMPACYKDLTPVISWKTKAPWSQNDKLKALDRWSL